MRKQYEKKNPDILKFLEVIVILMFLQMMIKYAGGSKRSMGEAWWTEKDQRGVVGMIDDMSDGIKFMIEDVSK